MSALMGEMSAFESFLKEHTRSDLADWPAWAARLTIQATESGGAAAVVGDLPFTVFTMTQAAVTRTCPRRCPPLFYFVL